MSLQLELLSILDKINLVVEGIDNMREHIDKLNEEKTLLEYQDKSLKSNFNALKRFSSVVSLSEYVKVKNAIRANNSRLKMVTDELRSVQKILKSQQQRLDELLKAKESIMNQLNKVVVRMSDYVKRSQNENNGR